MNGASKFSFLSANKPLFFCLVIVSLAFASTLAAALTTAKPIGSDYYFHLNIAEDLARGDVQGAWDFTLTANRFPYALFAFHWLLVPTVWSGAPLLCAKILQVLFLPVTLALTMGLVYRFASPMAAVYSGAILFSSWAFFDGALQVRPESLDLLLYPVLLGAVLCGQRWRFVGGSVLIVFSHGLASLSMVLGLAYSKLRVRGWRWPLAVGVLLILPVLVMSAFYVGGAFEHWGGAPVNENPQEVLFWAEPLSFIPYYMGASIIGLFFVFKKDKTVLERLALFSAVGLLLMLPLWADRFLHYVSLPLAILGGCGMAGLKDKWKLVLVLALLDIFVVYTASYFSFSLGIGGRWWQPGD